LFLAVVELVRGLFLRKLKMPGEYSTKPAEALTIFCGRYLEMMLYEGTILMCRVCMGEAARFPEGAAQYFDVIFAEVHTRLAGYLKTTFGLSARGSAEAAQKLLGQTLYPRFARALFGIEKPVRSFDAEDLAADFDVKPIRRAVGELIEVLQRAG
jgi:hypothetical protein